jgi:hypothetical protein
MTIEEFLTEFHALKGTRAISRGGTIRLLREHHFAAVGDVPTVYHCCPIVAVAAARWPDLPFRNSDFYIAARAIGLFPDDTSAIYRAADNTRRHDPELRRQLLDGFYKTPEG